MSDVDAIDRALRPVAEAAAELARSAGQVAGEPRGPGERAAAIPAARDALARLRGQARAVLDRLDDADSRLAGLAGVAVDAPDFGQETWPARRDALAAALATDSSGGAAAWLAAWARAFLAGCPAEADRLAAGPFALPPEALWCPDRLTVATDALRDRSSQRLAPLLRYLAAGAALGGRPSLPADLRARAQVMHARLHLHAGQHEAAADLLGRAGLVGDPGLPEVLAARAALARLSADAEDTTSRASHAWQAGRCAAAAVEMFYAERRGPGKPLGDLDTARTLVGELPPVTDPEGALDVLILPVPDEIWLAAADRAVMERDFEAGRRLAGRIGPRAAPLLAAEAADLQARIAAETAAAAPVRADLLDAAGLAHAMADQPQRAIERYTEALALVSGHQDATLGLADALLMEGRSMPLREAAGQFHRAVELIDTNYARHPLQAGTSWSLVTYSYLASALANQVVMPARAREIWRAPIAAARAIAFDPSRGQRWALLAGTMIELNCHQTAAVLSGHAMKLAPGDRMARRNMIAAITNLGDVGAALERLGEATPDSGDAWTSAIRAIVLQVSARGMSGQAEAARLDQALGAANAAVRTEPQNLLYHLIRAEVLLRTGKDDLAGPDFEYLWRESRLDQVDGLSYAARAAIELRLGGDAVALSTQLLDLVAATGAAPVGNYSAWFNRGAALALSGDPDGLPYLKAAVGAATTTLAVDYIRSWLSHLVGVLRREGVQLDLTAVASALDVRAAQIAADDRPALTRVEAELDSAARNKHYPPEVAELATAATALTKAWCGLALGDPGALPLLSRLAGQHPEYPELASAAEALAAGPPPGLPPAGGPAPGRVPAQPEPGQPVLRACLPGSWRTSLDDPQDHEIIKRFVPDAQARLRHRTGAVLPGVRFRDDAALEPAGFRILLHGSVVAEGRLRPGRWYCQDHLTAALGPEIRAQLAAAPEAVGPGPFPALSSFPAPEDPDPLTVLVAWPPAEVVARRIEHAYAAWQEAQQSGGCAPGEPAPG